MKFVYLAVGLVVLAGCTSVEPVTTPTPAAQGEESTTTTSMAATSTTAGTTSTTEAETLAGFLGFGPTGDPGAFAAELHQAETRVQEAIRLCMTRVGFDYMPIIPPEPSANIGEPPEQEPVFGIEALLDDPGEVDLWVDPNQETVEAMSEAERDAWFAELYGTGEDQPGCMTESYQAEPVFSGGGVLPDDLETELAAMNQRVASDTRVVDAEQEWSRCLGEQGFSYFSIETFYSEMEADFAPRFEAIVPPITYYGGPDVGWQEVAFGDPFPGWTDQEIERFLQETAPEELIAFFEEALDTVLATVDEEALIAVQRERYELEQAHEQCASEYREVRDEVQRELEAEFIRTHRDALERFRDGS